MLDGLTDVPLTSEEDGVRTSRGTESELVEGQSLTTGSGDPLSGGCGESESGDSELGDNGETLVIEDRADNDDSLGSVLVRVGGLLDNSGEGNRGSVNL